MADLMCLPEGGVVKAPAHLSDEEAATLPCAALTAWSAVVTYDDLGPGSRVLVQGTGGVALFALQFAKLLGAHVTVISSSDEKIARAKAMGADAAINYATTPEWAKATREITGGRGYDHIVELGGEKTLPQSLRCIRPGGTLSMIGVLSGSSLAAPLGLVVTRQVRLQGITVGQPRRVRGDDAGDRAAQGEAGGRPGVRVRAAQGRAGAPQERGALREDRDRALTIRRLTAHGRRSTMARPSRRRRRDT